MFLPVLSNPIVGSVNYFSIQRVPWAYLGGDGVAVLACGALAALLALLNRGRMLLAPGLLSLSILTDNPFRHVANPIQIQWGFGVLLLGAIALIAAAIFAMTNPTPRSAHTPRLGDDVDRGEPGLAQFRQVTARCPRCFDGTRDGCPECGGSGWITPSASA